MGSSTTRNTDMRYLAIDLGAKRTGLAMADDEVDLAHPLEVLEVPCGEALLAAVAAAAADHDAGALVVGLPLNMDGSEGPAAIGARETGAALAELTGLEVHFQDERLTSAAAEAHLDGSGRTHGQKKKVRDALAALEILREFLGSR